MKYFYSFYWCAMLRQYFNFVAFFYDDDTAALVFIKRSASVHSFSFPPGTYHGSIFVQLNNDIGPVYAIQTIGG